MEFVLELRCEISHTSKITCLCSKVIVHIFQFYAYSA